MPNPTSLKSFFGFTRHPFPPSCPPEPLFRSSALDSAIEQAKNALASRLSLLVTAPPGFGKSSFLRLLVAELNPRDLKPVRLTGQGLGFMELIAKLSDELGIETSLFRGRTVKFLASGLRRLAASGPMPVVVIDEAQNVPVVAINQLRLLAEEQIPPLLAMVLVGDDTLRRTLAKPAHVALAGRLAARIELAPLSLDETEAFVTHGFQGAGMQNLLAPSSVATVHAASGGSPRGIGSILSRAMNRAWEKKSRLLTDEIVQEVIDERVA
ncbi:MAG: AAA family ATPase [Betaproteobacteria bacterium]|nr:AAA family ATPase [Betaproteobacteria bacterium]